VITREQLIELRFSRSAIEHRIATGRLHPVHDGVYAVGRRELTRLGVWMAAVLACGEGAVLSHDDAGALWLITPDRHGDVHVSLPPGSDSRRGGIKPHRRSAIRPT
jgi:hypothetical protein